MELSDRSGGGLVQVEDPHHNPHHVNHHHWTDVPGGVVQVPSASIPSSAQQQVSWGLGEPSSCIMVGEGGGGTSTNTQQQQDPNLFNTYHHALHRYALASLPLPLHHFGVGQLHSNIQGVVGDNNPGVVDQGGGGVDQGMQNGLSEFRGGPEQCSEDEDEEEEESEEDDDDLHMEESDYNHGHPHPPPDSTLDLPSCQQQHHHLPPASASAALIDVEEMDDPTKNHLNHVQQLEDDIPPITGEHPLTHHHHHMPLGGSPQDPCGSLMMPSAGVGVGGNPELVGVGVGMNDGLLQNNQDSNPGNSVHGKMYVQGRVTFYLKQWSDSGFGTFNSCREESQKNQYACAVCQSRCSQDGLQSKDGTQHRHQIRGSFVSFGDCIFLELHPDQEEDYLGEQDQNPMNFDPKSQSLTTSSVPSVEKDVEVDVEPMHSALSYYSTAASGMGEIAPLTNGGVQGPGPSSSLDKSPSQQQSQGGWWQYQNDNTTNDKGPTTSGGNLPLGPAGTLQENQNQQQQSETFESCAMNLSIQQFQQDPGESTSDLLHRTEHQHNPVLNEVEIEDQQNQSCIPNQQTTTASIVIHHHNPYEHEQQQQQPDHESESQTDEPINQESPPHQPEPENNGLQDPGELPVSSVVVPLLIPSNAKSPVLKSKKPKKLTKDKKRGLTHHHHPYKCPTCEKSFKTKNHLKSHLSESHSSGNPYQCPQCKIQFADASRLSKHSCTLSVESIKKRAELKQTKLLQKEMQDKFFLNKGEEGLREPKDISKVHQDDVKLPNSSKVRKFARTVCKPTNSSESDTQLSNDENSSATTSSSSSLPCPTNLNNEKPSTSKDSLKLKFVRVQQKPSSKGLTKKLKPKKPSLGSHRPIKVNQDQNLTPTTTSEPLPSYLPPTTPTMTLTFPCKICQKPFSTQKQLHAHFAHHSISKAESEKEKQCVICQKKFARRDKLMRHMFSHSEKQFSCEICEKKFSRRDKLADHQKSHQNDEVHECPEPGCKRTFARPDIFKQHLKTHKKEDKHQCQYCLRFISGFERWKVHERRHVEAMKLGQSLTCSFCPKGMKGFITSQSLRAHMRKFHQKERLRQQEEGGGNNSDSGSGSGSGNVSDDCQGQEDNEGLLDEKIRKIPEGKSKARNGSKPKLLKKKLKPKPAKKSSQSSSSSSENEVPSSTPPPVPPSEIPNNSEPRFTLPSCSSLRRVIPPPPTEAPVEIRIISSPNSIEKQRTTTPHLLLTPIPTSSQSPQLTTGQSSQFQNFQISSSPTTSPFLQWQPPHLPFRELIITPDRRILPAGFIPMSLGGGDLGMLINSGGSASGTGNQQNLFGIGNITQTQNNNNNTMGGGPFSTSSSGGGGFPSQAGGVQATTLCFQDE